MECEFFPPLEMVRLALTSGLQGGFLKLPGGWRHAICDHLEAWIDGDEGLDPLQVHLRRPNYRISSVYSAMCMCRLAGRELKDMMNISLSPSQVNFSPKLMQKLLRLLVVPVRHAL